MESRSRKLIQIVLAVNGLFWAWFWIDVWRHTVPYADRAPKFEEVVPVYKFGSKALPYQAERTSGSFRSMLICQRPSFFVVGQAASRITTAAWDRRLGALSIGAYALFGTMLLSFAQWGFVAMVIGRVLAWAGGRQGATAHRPA